MSTWCILSVSVLCSPPTLETLARSLTTIGGTEHFPPAILLLLFFAGVAVKQWWADRRLDWIIVASAMWLAIPLVSIAAEFLTGSQAFSTRALLWTAVPLYLMVAVGLSHVWTQQLQLAVISVILALNVYGMVMEARATTEPWDVVSDTMSSHLHEDHGFVFCPGWPSRGAAYYFFQEHDPGEANVYGWRGDRIRPMWGTTADYRGLEKVWVISSFRDRRDCEKTVKASWPVKFHENRLVYGADTPSYNYVRRWLDWAGIPHRIGRSHILVEGRER